GLHVERAPRVGGDKAVGSLHGIPVLGPAIGAVRRKATVLEWCQRARLGGLVEQPSRLYLGVLPVGISKQLFPDHALSREAPDPELLPRLLVMRCVAHHPEILGV